MAIELFSRVDVGAGGVNSISFTSIPQTGKHLLLKVSLRNSTSATFDSIFLYLNGSTTSLTFARLTGSNAASSSAAGTNLIYGAINGNSATSGIFSNTEVLFSNYAASRIKSYSADAVVENNATTATPISVISGRFNDTPAITSITLESAGSPPFAQYSSASLYIVS